MKHFTTPKVLDIIEQSETDGSIMPHENKMRLDLRLGNLCNLRCLFCSTNNSTRWYQDADLIDSDFKKESIHSRNRWLETETCKKLILQATENATSIHFAGGEPLINKMHLKILRSLIQKRKTNKKITYITNLTYLSDDILNLWLSFDDIHVIVSLDGDSKVAPYFRYPFNWHRFTENLMRLNNAKSNLRISISSNISVMTLFSIPKMIHEIKELRLDRLQKLSLDNCTSPRIYCTSHLPPIAKDRLKGKLSLLDAEMLNAQFEVEGFQEIISNIGSNYSPSRLLNLINFLDKVDSRQNMEWRKICPELADLCT